MTKKQMELKEEILRMVIERADATVSEARAALSDALIEYDSISREMTSKKPVQYLAEVLNARTLTKK